MSARSVKYSLSILISFLLILTIFAAIWASPLIGVTLGLIFLLFALIATSYTIIRKNREAYLQGEITLHVSVRNSCLEITAILLAMVLAGLLGRYLTALIARGMVSDPLKLVTGIGVGLLAGWGVGLSVKQVSSRFIKTSSGS